MPNQQTSGVAATMQPADRVAELKQLEAKVLWLATWMVHHANHLRPKTDGLKVGGHQASCASMVTIMTALYFEVLEPHDRVAVKPHASPVFHAIQYLFGRQSLAALQRFRAFGGAQSYPSRTKDADDVDFSTGSVGLGVAMTTFASLVQDYVRARTDSGQPSGRMVALLGDAEFDEGNIFEAMLEGWKHDVRRLWWIVDYNRQSLDGVADDRLADRMASVFRSMEWQVVNLRYGTALEQAFRRRGGDALRIWLDALPNLAYASLAHAGGASWRRQLMLDLGSTAGIREWLDAHDDTSLHALMTNVGGHDLETLLKAFDAADPEVPTCFIAHTIKGHRLPFAGHKDNHAGLMSPAQVAEFRASLRIDEGHEWEPAAGLDLSGDELADAVSRAPFARRDRHPPQPPTIPVPARLAIPPADQISTQEGFGRLLSTIARAHPELADHLVTTSPDVTVSTNLGPWVNRRGVFGPTGAVDTGTVAEMASAQKWVVSPAGQHIELGIAENNLFILLAALGLSDQLFGHRLLPIGTVYDPFISRGLDALNYACYQDARFILVATPSGVTLAPEGGAHQSISAPLIGLAQPSLTAFEPAYVDELAEILRWSFEHLQADDGGSVYLRLSTRPLAQPTREMSGPLAADVLSGAYWLVTPKSGSDLAIVATGPVVQEAVDALMQIAEDIPGAGLLVVTSADLLHRHWRLSQHDASLAATCHVEHLLKDLSPHAGLVTIVDGHPATLSWLGSVRRHRVISLGVEHFGQSGNIPDLYQAHGINVDAIVDAVARLSLTQ